MNVKATNATLYIDGESIQVNDFNTGVDLSTEQDFTAYALTDGKLTVTIPMEHDPNIWSYLNNMQNIHIMQKVMDRWFNRFIS